MDLAAVIPNLKAKLARADERLAKLRDRRRPHALGAATGDAKAKKAIEKINAEAAAARNEADNLTIAIEEAERRKAEHEAQTAAEDRRRREAEARAICASVLEADRNFDQTAEQLCRSLADREELVRKLGGLGVVYPGITNALRRKQSINAALIHAGLHRFADLHHVPPNFHKPLVELERWLSNPTRNRAPDSDQPTSALAAGSAGPVETKEARP